MIAKWNIKVKALVFLGSSIFFALFITGVLQYFHLYNYHKTYAIEKIDFSQKILNDEMNNIFEQNSSILHDLVSDAKITSSLSLVTSYQDTTNYQAVLFDEVKTTLLSHLINKISLFDEVCVTLFDAKGELVSYVVNNSVLTSEYGIGTYKDGDMVHFNPYQNQIMDLGFITDSLNFDKDIDTYKVVPLIKNNIPFISISKSIEVKSFDKIVGYIKLTRHLDEEMIKKFSDKTGTTIDIYFNDLNFKYITLDNGETIKQSIKSLVDYDDNFIKSFVYSIDEYNIVFVNAISKEAFLEQIKSSIFSLFLTIIVAFLLVLPFVYFLIEKQFLQPMSNLLEAILQIQNKNYDINIQLPQNNDVTIQQLATSITSMATSIKNNENEIKIRKFYDKLVANVSTIFLNDKSFDLQIKSAIKLLTRSLQARRVVLQTFVQSQSVKPKYSYGHKCNIDGLCDKCLCISEFLLKNSKDIIFVKDVNDNDIIQECNIAMENDVQAFIVLPINFKETRMAILVIEFYEVKLSSDVEHSYLLKPLESIFANVLNYELNEEENTAREQMLFQQSKMASMGEMIGNIAHQWRQPLSAITTASSALQLKDEYGILTKEDIIDFNNSIINNANYLSKTIDDFRNFFKSSKTVEIFTTKNLIENSLKIVDSSLKNHYIKVELNITDDKKIKGLLNEATQGLINIINNAKDAIIATSPEIRKIFISTYTQEKYVVISIKDVGGGISDDIVDKIFEPYFTTKHKSQGTGIGLYMTSEIVVKHLKGKIEVHNTTTLIDEKEYNGAEFLIYLPYEEAK
ncbi:sensor histidine kinase [Arcobacter sp. FWKO B]|uniref:sensor histidine kinase n=1 Tax=Arcobacter sp. FWKO B TaxID=2593672 RepID=UPI0018A42E99|nr:HAMP domain-containing sensor histidine kinase [Arcobacter sp. FWKO B]QOG11593.1 hypothetical protein FWKOB_02265 [Arcobacter sp. FWKO B]